MICIKQPVFVCVQTGMTCTQRLSIQYKVQRQYECSVCATYTLLFLHPYLHHAHTHTHENTHMCVHAHTYTHAHTYIHTHAHVTVTLSITQRTGTRSCVSAHAWCLCGAGHSWILEMLTAGTCAVQCVCVCVCECAHCVAYEISRSKTQVRALLFASVV
jgi:hypothetical protein